MKSYESINKVVNYIEDNLSKKITIEELAEIANLSPFYFQRLFKRIVEKPAMEYIKLRRLQKVSEELKISNNDSILDIAKKYGFNNHETFTRNFKKAYNITPSQYRENPVILKNFLKPNINLMKTIVDEDVPIITDGIVLEVTRYSLNESKYFLGFITTGDLEITGIDPFEDVWNEVHKTKINTKGYMVDGNEIGVNLDLSGETNDLKYFAGFEVNKFSKDNQLEKFVLNRGKYLVCKFEAENFNTLITDTIFKVYNYMFLWITNKKLMSKVKNQAIELYYGSTNESSYMELWIPFKD